MKRSFIYRLENQDARTLERIGEGENHYMIIEKDYWLLEFLDEDLQIAWWSRSSIWRC
jgi:hypothetical protein